MGRQGARSDVVLEEVERRFEQRGGQPLVTALRGVSLRIASGEAVAVVGASGSGKTTLLKLIAALDRPTAGSVVVGGVDLDRLGRRERAAYRRRTGMIFQEPRLVPALSALENVAAPPLLPHRQSRPARERAKECLSEVGLASRLDARPSELSGGQRQRVAIARALAADPILLLADEPTGNLDAFTGRGILDLLFDVRERCRTSLVLVTHDPSVSESCDRVVRLEDGVVVSDPAGVRAAQRLSQAGRAAGRRRRSATG